MRIALGSDHHGVRAISQLTEHLRETGHDPIVLGTQEGESWDYPDSAYLVGEAVRRGEADMGILVCGSASL
jgi:ribose 5-phosphate isomerase B